MVLEILVEAAYEFSKLPPEYLQKYLHAAAEHGWVGLLDFLLKDEEDHKMVDAEDGTKDGRTPLCVAAEKGHTELVRRLVNEYHAKIDHQTTSSRDTPLILAIRGGHEGVVEVLVEAGAKVKLENSGSESAWLLASTSNHVGIFNTVLAVADEDFGLDTEFQGQDGCDFNATVFDFFEESGVMKAYACEYPVSTLLQNPQLPGNLDDDKLGERPYFRWLHLPANNVSRRRIRTTLVCYESCLPRTSR